MNRLLTAAILIPICLFALFWGPGWFLWLVIAAVTTICSLEFGRMAGLSFGERALAVLVGLALLAPRIKGDIAAVVLFSFLALMFSLRREQPNGIARAGALFLGVFYIFGAFKFGWFLYEHNRWYLFFALAINWIGDSAAYYAGRAFGRHKIAPRISPNKTLEGSLASIAAAVIAADLVAPHFLPLTPQMAVVLAFFGNIAGQFGDLTESALKRGAGVKDSGGILPGHGGMLDRLDSTLFTLPVVYLLVMFLEKL